MPRRFEPEQTVSRTLKGILRIPLEHASIIIGLFLDYSWFIPGLFLDYSRIVLELAIGDG